MTNSNANGWQETEAALSALINGKRRADGANWADAFSMSQHYLKVRIMGVVLAYMGISSAYVQF